jgi:hypothetical protein
LQCQWFLKKNQYPEEARYCDEKYCKGLLFIASVEFKTPLGKSKEMCNICAGTPAILEHKNSKIEAVQLLVTTVQLEKMYKVGKE